jgi:hypothetical protein
MIELQSIVRNEAGTFDAVFADGDNKWTVRCTAREIQTFAAFQRVVADKLGLFVRHECQQYRQARYGVERWQDEVSIAFDAGAGR